MNCTHCESDKTAKSGRDRKGLQRYSCKDCKTTFTEPHALAGKKTSIDDAARVLAMLLEGMSINSCVRLTGVNKKAVLSILVQAGESCRRFTEAKIQNMNVEMVECDEQWAFVGCKQRTAERLRKGRMYGDRYVFTGIDRDSKLLLCWHCGPRDSDTMHGFMVKLKDVVSGETTINTDGFAAYQPTIREQFRFRAAHATIVKMYAPLTPPRNAQARYSPGGIISVTRRVVSGNVAEEDIGTSRMERFNLTTRMTLRRFTRLTNGHSKKQRNHDAMLGLYFAWYNFCRKHQTIKATPAVKAGLTNEIWTLERLLKEAATAC